MFYHETKPGKGHKLLLKTLLPITMRPNWDRKGFRPTIVSSLVSEVKMEGCVFFCEECAKIIPLEEVYSRCFQCNEKISIEEAVSPDRSLGIYCKKHGKEHFPDEKPLPILKHLGLK